MNDMLHIFSDLSSIHHSIPIRLYMNCTEAIVHENVIEPLPESIVYLNLTACDDHREISAFAWSIDSRVFTMPLVELIFMYVRFLVNNRLTMIRNHLKEKVNTPAVMQYLEERFFVQVDVNTNCLGIFSFETHSFFPIETLLLQNNQKKNSKTSIKAKSPISHVSVSIFRTESSQSPPSIEVVMLLESKSRKNGVSFGKSIFFSHSQAQETFLIPNEKELVPINFGRKFFVTVSLKRNIRSSKICIEKPRMCSKHVIQILQNVSDPPIISSMGTASSFKAALILSNAISRVVDRSSNESFKSTCKKILDSPAMAVSTIVRKFHHQSHQSQRIQLQ